MISAPLRPAPLAIPPIDGLVNLVAAAPRHTYRRSQPLYLEGARPDACYLVLSGWVGVTRYSESGGGVMLRLAGRGDIVGLAGVLLGLPQPGEAVGITSDTEVAAIGAGLLAQHVEAYAGLAYGLLEYAARELATTQARLADLLTCRSGPPRPTFRKLIRVLQDLPPFTDIPLTHEQLGLLAGVVREEATRWLGRLKESGAITSRRTGEFRIADPELLASLERGDQ